MSKDPCVGDGRARRQAQRPGRGLEQAALSGYLPAIRLWLTKLAQARASDPTADAEAADAELRREAERIVELLRMHGTDSVSVVDVLAEYHRLAADLGRPVREEGQNGDD